MKLQLVIAEKRREPRHKASGNVWISYLDPAPRRVDGKLVDVSANGFRMSHRCATLAAGAVVEFDHHAAKGYARVMWNRMAGEQVETGFLVID